jgi:hypothetical protein
MTASTEDLTPDREYSALLEVIAWIDQHTTKDSLPTDERSLIAQGCLDAAIEYQAAVAVLHYARLHGSMLALLRVLTESLVRGLWLQHCANDAELTRFKSGAIDKPFGKLIEEIEERLGNTSRTLSNLKASAWTAMNDFTHTGFIQVTRRHAPGAVGANYPAKEIAEALSAAAVLGLIAAGALIGMTGNADLADAAIDRMKQYANRRAEISVASTGPERR